MAGGSQILIDDQGITISTGGKLYIKQGNINLRAEDVLKLKFLLCLSLMKLRLLPINGIFMISFYEADFSNVQYKLINNKK